MKNFKTGDRVTYLGYDGVVISIRDWVIVDFEKAISDGKTGIFTHDCSGLVPAPTAFYVWKDTLDFSKDYYLNKFYEEIQDR